MSDRPKATKRREKKGSEPIGRPLSDINIEFVQHLAGLGMTQDQIAKRIGVSLPTFTRRMAADENIRLAYEKGKGEGLEELLTFARKGVQEGQPALTIFSLKNLANWTDKQKIEADVNVSGWSAIARRIAEGKIPMDEVDDEDDPQNP